MNCEKTGCVAYLHEYQHWVRGDSFRTKRGDLVIRVSSRHHSEPGPVNYEVRRIDHWFDNRGEGTSTMFVSLDDFEYYGYNGDERRTYAEKLAEFDAKRPKLVPVETLRGGSHKQHSLKPIPVGQMRITLAGVPDAGKSGDGKCQHTWRFLADGQECAVWDYKGERWSGYGPKDVFERLGLL